MGLSSPSGSPSPSYKFPNMDEDTAGSSVRQFHTGKSFPQDVNFILFERILL